MRHTACRETSPGARPLIVVLSLLIAAAVSAAPLNDATGAVSVRSGDARGIVVDLPASAHADEFYLRPGGPYLRAELDLGVAATDVALADDFAFVAAGRDGLLVATVGNDKTAQIVARLPLAGAVSLIRTVSSTAYLSGTGGLFVVDIADPAAPHLRSHYRTPAAAIALAVHGTRAWLLFERELQLLDLSGDRPVMLARKPLASVAYGLAVTDEQVFIANGPAGILVLDARNPTAPTVTARTTGPALDVAAQDGKLYVADGDAGVVVFDTAVDNGAEAAPRWLGSFRRIPALRHIAVAGTRALAAGVDGGLYMLDISRPQFPSLLAILPMPQRGNGYALAVGAASVVADGRLITYDLRPEPPRLGNEGLDFGQGVNLGGQRRVFIDGNTAYVADWFSGLHLYDIRDAHRPVLLSSFHTDGSSKGVVVRDGTAFVADDDHGLQILDVRDPRHPVRIAELATPGLAYTPVLDGNLLYLASHRGGFVIIDVSDIRAPQTIAQIDTPGKSWSLRVRDGILYVADDDSGLLVFDVSDPHVPHQIGQFKPGGAAEEVLLDGDRAYVAFFDRGVYTLDIRNPAAPVALGHVATPGNARGLDRRDNLLYVADWLAGIQVVDVRDPAQPRIVGGYDTDGAAWGVQLHENFAYVMDWWGGISVLDISRSPSVRRAGGYPRKDTVRAVAIRDRFAFVAQDDAGMQVFDIENPLNPIWMTGVDLAAATQVVTLNDRAYVLHDRKRLAELDISDPYQTRLIDDLPLVQSVRALTAAADRLLLTEDRAVTLYDPVERKATRYPLTDRISGAGYADGRFYLAVPGRGLVVATPEHGQMKRLATYPVSGETGQLRIAGQRAYLAVAGEGMRILALNDAGISDLARLPLAGEITDIQLDGDSLYAITDHADIYAFDVGDPAQWHIKNRYNTLGEATGLVARGNFIYLAGNETLTALQALPSLAVRAGSDGQGHVSPSSDLPAGAYDLIAVDRAALPPDRIMRRTAVVVEALRFGKPKITPEQFNTLKQQYLKSLESP